MSKARFVHFLLMCCYFSSLISYLATLSAKWRAGCHYCKNLPSVAQAWIFFFFLKHNWAIFCSPCLRFVFLLHDPGSRAEQAQTSNTYNWSLVSKTLAFCFPPQSLWDAAVDSTKLDGDRSKHSKDTQRPFLEKVAEAGHDAACL